MSSENAFRLGVMVGEQYIRGMPDEYTDSQIQYRLVTDRLRYLQA